MNDSHRFDPDTRFLLANERTLLAWIRTSIALQAGGLVLAHFSSNLLIQKAFSFLIVAFGGSMALFGYARFRAADRAIRTQQLPSIGRAPAIQAAGVTAIAVALLIGIVFGLH
jgi:inner membrane protein YidH